MSYVFVVVVVVVVVVVFAIVVFVVVFLFILKFGKIIAYRIHSPICTIVILLLSILTSIYK